MAHEVIHVVRGSAEAGGVLLAIGGAALGFYVATPTCTPASLGLFPKPPVCSNKIGTVHVTGKPIGARPGEVDFYMTPDDHQVGWALGGIAVGAAIGGAIGYLWRDLRGAAG